MASMSLTGAFSCGLIASNSVFFGVSIFKVSLLSEEPFSNLLRVESAGDWISFEGASV